MSIDTIHTMPVEDESQPRSVEPTGTSTDRSPATRRVLEVSEVDADEVTAYARTVDDSEVYLERKGGRTYLVAD